MLRAIKRTIASVLCLTGLGCTAPTPEATCSVASRTDAEIALIVQAHLGLLDSRKYEFYVTQGKDCSYIVFAKELPRRPGGHFFVRLSPQAKVINVVPGA
jgi:hypothetical protein